MTPLQKDLVDIVETIENEGISLSKSGARMVAICPFHSEKNPSFYIYPETQSYHCFGCGAHGDAIDFIRQYHSVDFRAALKILGICRGPLTTKQRETIQQEIQKRNLVDAFRKWEKMAIDEVQTLIRCGFKVTRDIRKLRHLDAVAPIFHALPVWEYHLQVLLYGSDLEKLKLFEAGEYGLCNAAFSS